MDEKLEAKIRKIVGDLQTALGENLLSVVLYGSAARGDHHGATSDLNLMAVVADGAPGRLESAARAQGAWVKDGNHPILFVTPEWIRGATDVFPMEFLDMIEAHRTVHGSDPLAGVTVSPANLRLQCESEMRSKILKMRSAYLDAHGSARDLFELIVSVHGPLAASARAALRLAGEQVPARSEEVFDAAARRFGLDAASLREAGDLKRAGRAGPLVRMRAIFLGLFDQMEALARAINAMESGTGPKPDRRPGG
jgi:hypothetical protein